MSDLQALYHTFKDAPDSAPIVAEESKLVTQEGTFRERLRKHLGEYEPGQIDKSFFKGLALHKMMLADAKEAGQMMTPPRYSAESEFQAVKDLQRFRYNMDTRPSLPDILLLRVALLLENIGIESCVEQEACTDINHGHNSFISHYVLMTENFLVDGKSDQWRVCGFFNQVINPRDGIIVAVDNLSPTEANRAEGLKAESIPDLKSWSDVAFLQWKSRASETSDLKYVIRYNVLNFQTNFVVEAINFAHNHDATPLSWPGHSYDAGSQEGRALLGTPNGSSVAYMLIQHKHELGHKTVEKVTVFHKDKSLMLLFHIVDVNMGSIEQVQAGS